MLVFNYLFIYMKRGRSEALGRLRTKGDAKRRRIYREAWNPAMVAAVTSSRPMFVPRVLGNPRAVTERKYFDSENAGITIQTKDDDWTGTEVDPTANSLFTPVTGDDFNHRTGRKVQVLSLKIKGYLSILQNTNETQVYDVPAVRIVLYQDKQTNGAQAQGENVISSGAADDAILMFQNPANFGRFRILKDKYFTMPQPMVSWDGTNIEQGGLGKPFKWNINFKIPVFVHFNATNGGTIADIIDNSFHIIAAKFDQGTPVDIFLQYKCRTTFLDQ